MADLVIYNSETLKKEKFEPLSPGQVKMYVCGPTVYDYLHVGNFRGPIFFNLVRNWLEEGHGYKVTYVYNYTDVDDRIIDKAIKDNKPSTDISEFYIKAFESDFSRLGLRKHDKNPRVTEYIKEIVAIIQKIIDNGLAYVRDGEVIFSTRKFKEYGRLSHKNLDELMAGIRIEVSDKKENPLDFTLWKPAKPGEPKWPSPWSEGRPGWHIECSAMASSILGEQIDIHGGGIDLIFPHHENEIAQSEAACGKKFVRYWMHNNFINFGAQKMSKSLGNVKTAHSFLDHFGAEVLKFLILRAHYRTLVDFSDGQIQDAIQGLGRIYSALAVAQDVLESGVASESTPKAFVDITAKADQEVANALNDDFNTPKVMAQIYEVVRYFNGQHKRGQKPNGATVGLAKAFLEWIKKYGKLMSLFQEDPKTYLSQTDDLLLERKNLKRPDVQIIVDERVIARKNKDFKKSDVLRDQLLAMGIQIQDTPQGTFWEVAKATE